MSKIDKIALRIKVLEEKTGKSGNMLGVGAGLGNGTVDGWTDKHLDYSKPGVSTFLNCYNIDKHWWQTGEGDIFKKNSTDVDKPYTDKEIVNGRDVVYKTIVEGHTEYVLIPRSVLNETQLVSSEQIRRTWDELSEKNKELERKNKQIDVIQSQLTRLLEKIELPGNSTDSKEVKNKG